VWGFGFLLLTVAGIWVFIDFLVALFGAMKDKDGKSIKKW